MWVFIIRKILYNIPVYLGIILFLMLALRVQDPVRTFMGKNVTEEAMQVKRTEMGLDQSFPVQYVNFLKSIPTLDFGDSWKYEGTPVRQKLLTAIKPSLSFTVPTLVLSTVCAICIALLSAYFRGGFIDKGLVLIAVIGMSVSYLVYILLGMVFLAQMPLQQDWALHPFSINGYEDWIGWTDKGPFFAPGMWIKYCMLPVIIGVIVSLGYDTRFYRAVMVEETGKDYITTAVAKGATKPKVMFVHMLKNAMIPIVTRVMATLPFLVTGSILVEMFFGIPGMGRQLIDAINGLDFPIIQAFVAIFALLFVASVILTDVVYALVDPRVRLS